MESIDNHAYESDNDHQIISISQNNKTINDELINNFKINSSTNQINCVNLENEITIENNSIIQIDNDKIKEKSINKSIKNQTVEFNIEIDSSSIKSQNNLIKSNDTEINQTRIDLKNKETNESVFENMEIEETKKKPNPFKNKIARQNFIKKLYLILLGQLLSSFIIFILLNKNDRFQSFAIKYFWLAIVFIILAFILVIPMSLNQVIRTKLPYNYIILSVFTLLFSVSISFVGDLGDQDTVELAISITAAIIICLTFLAVQNLISFNILNSVLICISICCLSSGISFIFYHAYNLPLINVVYAALISLIASMYIVIDTHLIIKGYRKEKYTAKITPDEYVYGALAIYIDTIRYIIVKLPKHISKINTALKYLR